MRTKGGIENFDNDALVALGVRGTIGPANPLLIEDMVEEIFSLL